MIDEHILKLGTHAEKDYLLLGRPWYTCATFAANLVEATASSLAVFAQSLRRFEKDYFIDPVTYAFSLPPSSLANENGVPKRTFRALARQYGGVIEECFAAGRAVRPSDFRDREAITRLCRASLRYQTDRLTSALRESTLGVEEEQLEELPPSKIVAPYFQITGLQEWLDLNVVFLDVAKEVLAERDEADRLWCVLCLDSSFLERQTLLQEILGRYLEKSWHGCLLWILGFQESRATLGQIRGLRTVAETVAKSGRKLTMLYGGYFSAVLSAAGMTGISHGIGYGEKRELLPPVGGGLPPAKYYLRAIHDSVSIIPDLAFLANRWSDVDSYISDICDCIICSRLLERGVHALLHTFSQTQEKVTAWGLRSFATPAVYKLARFHYLHNRHAELQHINSTTWDKLLSQMRDAYEQFSPLLGGTDLTYLLVWQEALAT